MRSIVLRPGTGPLLKVLIIIAMLLLFLIPLSLTRSLVGERQSLARRRIPEVSRPILPYWNPEEIPVKFHRSQVNTQQNNHEYLEDYALDAELLEPLGTYARTERSVKYGALILIIPFVVFFLFEVLGGVRVHPVQYLLAGAADIVFYLLLPALSEHWQFDAAYLTAAAAVTLLLSVYAAEVTPSRRSALAMPGVMAAAYLWRLRPAHRSPHHRRRNVRYPKSELVHRRPTPPRAPAHRRRPPLNSAFS